MTLIRQEAADRQNEIEVYVNLIKNLETGDYRIWSDKNGFVSNLTTEKTTQKASSILLMYNYIEYIMTKCLQRIHDEIICNTVPYLDLNEKLQILVLAYHHSVSNSKVNHEDIAININRTIRLITHQQSFCLKYDDMIKYYSLYSGNLDSKKIKKILSKYGIPFNKECSELQFIKDLRNKLAHGEVSFEECGRMLTYQKLVSLKGRIFLYFSDLINAIDDYLSKKKYKKPSLLPAST